ncbi:hypothetical protein [Absidia glauca]|uniref:Ndc10 domain-containing protein n=1 Tax=Absidia glauca TaxID=4829 RepID=A0A168MDJ8_ABSGL|nr:hypothetical protein [Absidia glauca]
MKVIKPALPGNSIWNKDKTAPPGTGMVLRESIGKALSSPAIRSNKKTHINFNSSARMADIVCANEDQKRHRWSNTAMNGAFLTSLPREMMRSMGDFPTQGPILLSCSCHPLQEVVPGGR